VKANRGGHGTGWKNGRDYLLRKTICQKLRGGFDVSRLRYSGKWDATQTGSFLTRKSRCSEFAYSNSKTDKMVDSGFRSMDFANLLIINTASAARILSLLICYSHAIRENFELV
jgi:hypothetical protein